jgi:hypothetical protein
LDSKWIFLNKNKKSNDFESLDLKLYKKQRGRAAARPLFWQA